jgi:hypothetical protein
MTPTAPTTVCAATYDDGTTIWSRDSGSFKADAKAPRLYIRLDPLAADDPTLKWLVGPFAATVRSSDGELLAEYGLCTQEDLEDLAGNIGIL